MDPSAAAERQPVNQSAEQEDPFAGRTFFGTLHGTFDNRHEVFAHIPVQPGGREEWVCFGIPRSAENDAVVAEARARIGDAAPVIVQCLPRGAWELLLPPYAGTPQARDGERHFSVPDSLSDAVQVATYRFCLRVFFRSHPDDLSSFCPIPPPVSLDDKPSQLAFQQSVRRYFETHPEQCQTLLDYFDKEVDEELAQLDHQLAAEQEVPKNSSRPSA